MIRSYMTLDQAHKMQNDHNNETDGKPEHKNLRQENFLLGHTSIRL